MRRLFFRAAAIAAVAVLAACGGGDDEPPAEAGCMPLALFEAYVASGVVQPLPPLAPGWLWMEPWVVIMTPSPLQPTVGTLGPFYVPGTTPWYVCQEGALP